MSLKLTRGLQRFSDRCVRVILRPGTLFWVPTLSLSLLFFVAAFYFVLIGTGSGLFDQEWCFKPECIESFKSAFSPVYDLLSTSLAFVVALVTVLAAFTAVHTYQLSVKNNVLANHIAHFDMFRNYLSVEMDKLPRIDRQSVDGFKLFLFIFPRSRDGDFSPSDAYVKFIDRVSDLIISMEKKYSGENSEVFYSFKEHQNRVRALMAECGIQVALKPSKTDFFKVEREIYELLGRVNECFCASRIIKTIQKPNYS